MAKKRILIIDDDMGIGESLSDIFKEKGYLVSVANKGSVAIDKLKQNDFNIALVDIKLPDISGTELIRKIREINPETACIIITGHASVKNAVNALELEASAYITKPLDIDELLNRIKNALEKQRLKKELKESEEKYRLLIETTGDIVLLHDEKGCIKFVNQAGIKYTGFSKTEFLKHNIDEFMLEDEITKMQERAASRHAGNASELNIETEFISKAGNKINVDVKGSPIFKDGKFFAALIVARDITKRKRAEEALQKSEKKYRLLAENTLDCIWQMGADFKFIYVNPSVFQMLGFTQEEWIGSLLADHCSPDNMEVMGDLTREEIKKGSKSAGIKFETYLLHKSNREIPVEITAKVLFDKNEHPVGLQGITRDITERKEAEEKLKNTIDAAIDTMSNIIEAKDPYTHGHQHRVCQLAVSIARNMKLPKDKVEGIRIASLIHDIGKIGLPTEILSKPGKLTDIEFSLIKDHSQIGYDILKSIDFSYPIASVVLQHHERLDGSGYPNNLKDDEIILEAKIIGIADVVEAMSSFRPYRPALGVDAALEEITQNRGILYDPEVVDVCLRLFKEKGFKFE